MARSKGNKMSRKEAGRKGGQARSGGNNNQNNMNDPTTGMQDTGNNQTQV